MKIYSSMLLLGGCFLMTIIGLSSCSEYLDRPAEADISPDEPYKNFRNFQGFVEEIYYCVPEFEKTNWTNSFNWGDDEIISTGATWMPGYHFDNGNFWTWTGSDSWLNKSNAQANTQDRMRKGLWPLAWYGIRKANLGLENFDKFQEGTEEEKQIIKGQLYFFRGWFHFMLIQYWGGLPYIDKVLPSDQKLTLPRLTYQEVAARVAEDFRIAADLLPAKWDNTTVGKQTLNKNQLRVDKIAALGYLGKNYLWAGSPLMNCDSKGLPRDKTAYDAELCKKAADAFAELLRVIDRGESDHKLINFGSPNTDTKPTYADGSDPDKVRGYSSNFFTIGQNWKVPGDPEAIFRSPAYQAENSTWFRLGSQYQTKAIAGDADPHTYSPTANYVNYYGMRNGLPITDPQVSDPVSGYDPEYPWKNRDPRFYHDIVYDGVRIVAKTLSDPNVIAYQYAKLFYPLADINEPGSLRKDPSTQNRTGYLLYKFIPLIMNQWDQGSSWGNAFNIQLSYMRLPDIYLMYAESVVQGYGSPTSTARDYSLTAENAINTVRDRAGVGHVNAIYLANKELFMSEVRRERAVELAFEGHRFCDLRRWLLLTEYPYTLKQAIEFSRSPDFNTNNPDQNRIIGGLKYTTLLERKYSDKHYWLPLKTTDVSMYEGFPQNPGW